MKGDELLKGDGTLNRVLFVGAGMTGIEAARLFEERGFECVIVEKSGGVGGVWSLVHGSANIESRIQADPVSYRPLDDLSEVQEPNKQDPFSCMATSGGVIQKNLEARAKGLRVVFNVEVTNFAVEGERIRVFFRRTKAPFEEWSAVFAQCHFRTGCLCSVIDVPLPGQAGFTGIVASGTGNDVSLEQLRDQHVVIVGIGPFAVENVRRSLMANAKSITLLARSFNKPMIPEYTTYKLRRELQRAEYGSEEMRQLWRDAMEAMQTINAACGTSFTINDKTLRWVRGEPSLIFNRGVPATACNHMMLAFHYGLLDMREAQIASMGPGKKVLLRDGTELQADVVLKCFGFDVKQEILEGHTIEDSYFVEGRPNCTHNVRGDRVTGVKFLGFNCSQGFLISFYEDQEEYEPAIAAMNRDPSLWKAFREVERPIVQDITDVDYFSLLNLSEKLLKVPQLLELQKLNSAKRDGMYSQLLTEEAFLLSDKQYWEQMSAHMAARTGRPFLPYPLNHRIKAKE